MKSVPETALPEAEAYETVTVLSGRSESEATNVNVFVPEFPSVTFAFAIPTLHSNRRSWRWFLSPQPFPGFVEVGVVVDVLVDVEVEVDVDVEVEVDVELDVDVEVEVVVVVVIVVLYSYSDARVP